MSLLACVTEGSCCKLPALATRQQSAPIVPKARLLHVELAHNLQSPGVPSHTQVREPQSAMRRQKQPPVQGLWSPRSAMEAMNQSGQPRKSGKRGPMQPAPLTSGGLTLEEVTFRGWGPLWSFGAL